MKKKNDRGVFAAVRMAAASHRLLTVGTVLCVAASVAASLLPPLLLARVIDRLTAGLPLSFLAVLLYFGSLALEGVLTSAQESLLVLFGQRMTHALRSEMSRKLSRLPAGTLAEQNPGEVAARFSGDVDTVEALFTSGIISMAADACRIVSIMGVIAVKNTGLALILLLVLPLFAVFTRHIQKRMLAARDSSSQTPVDRLFERMARNYAGMKNYPEAMEYYAKAYHTADSLHKAEVETELSELSIKYENQEKELEIARLTQQHLEQKAKTMQWSVAAVAASSAFLLLAAYYVFRRKRIRKEEELKLAQSYIDGLERERTRLAKNLHDGVCNDLLGIGMNMQYMQPTDESKREILALLEQVRSDVRCISHELMPPKFQVTTLAETV